MTRQHAVKEKNVSQPTPERGPRLTVDLPAAPPPAANYIPTKRYGRLILISGQVPKEDGQIKYIGKLGDAISIEQGQAAARLCALNLIAQLKEAVQGDLSRVAGCLRLRGFVNATPNFTSHAAVINGASDLLIEVFGEKGHHTRTAIGVGSLPNGCAVEIDADFEILD